MQESKKGPGHSAGGDAFTGQGVDSEAYNKEMDEMRCILYAHGGACYFLI